jgi:hypothetical protein
LATIDYPRGELVLRKKTAASVKDVEKASAVKVVAVTMWLAGDHFIVTSGQVDENSPDIAGFPGNAPSSAEMRGSGLVIQKLERESPRRGGRPGVNRR